MRLLPLLLLVAACGTPRAPAPQASDGCAIAVDIRTRHPQESQWGHPVAVFFARIGPGGNPLRGREILRSNHVSAGTAYLLDAEPGRYVAVGCIEKRDGRDVTTTFPEGLVAATERRVEAGGFAFLGSHEVDQEARPKEGDAGHAHYAPLIEPDWRRSDIATRLFARSRYLYGSRHRALSGAPDAEARARKHLAESGWQTG